MKYLLIVFVLLSLSGCGVVTNSSKDQQNSNGNSGNDVPGPGSVPTDINNSGNASDGNSSNGSSQELMFDNSGGAEFDANACQSAYATAVPLQDDANSARETDDDANGISIMSLYRQTLVASESNIIAFYKTLPAGTVLQDVTKRKNLYGDNSQFIIMYDVAWADAPENTIYIETPKLGNKLDSCFRVTINSIDGTTLVPKKVYSYIQ